MHTKPDDLRVLYHILLMKSSGFFDICCVAAPCTSWILEKYVRKIQLAQINLLCQFHCPLEGAINEFLDLKEFWFEEIEHRKFAITVSLRVATCPILKLTQAFTDCF